jgi:hypothetical protein
MTQRRERMIMESVVPKCSAVESRWSGSDNWIKRAHSKGHNVAPLSSWDLVGTFVIRLKDEVAPMKQGTSVSTRTLRRVRMDGWRRPNASRHGA